MNTFPPRPCSRSLKLLHSKAVGREKRLQIPILLWPPKILESYTLVYNRTVESSPNTMSYSSGTTLRILTLALCAFTFTGKVYLM